MIKPTKNRATIIFHDKLIFEIDANYHGMREELRNSIFSWMDMPTYEG